MTDTQAADYNQALAAVLEAYDLLGEIVIAVPPPPQRGWNAPTHINDIYDRLWFALEKMAAIEPQVIARTRRQRLAFSVAGRSRASKSARRHGRKCASRSERSGMAKMKWCSFTRRKANT